jgi:hypothetical protein
MAAYTKIKVSRENFLCEYGFHIFDYPKWKNKWSNHVKQARLKGIESHISFEDYVSLAKEAGLTSVHQIGQHAGQYQLGRFTDRGNYHRDSCRFITVQKNQDERKLNGGTAVAVEKAAQKRRGQTKHTNEGLRKMAETISGRDLAEYPHLSVSGLKRGKPFELTSPDGVKHIGVSLYRWCKENGMSQATMNCLLRDPLKSYKGWTGRYLPADVAERVRKDALAQVSS